MFLRDAPDNLDYDTFKADVLMMGGCYHFPRGIGKSQMWFKAVVDNQLPLLHISMESSSVERLEEIVLRMNQTPARMLKLRHPKKPDVYEDAYAAAVAEEVPGVRQGILATAVRISTFKPDAPAVPDPKTDWFHDF